MLERVTRSAGADVWTARHANGTTQTLRIRSGDYAGRGVPALVRLRSRGLAVVYDVGDHDGVVWHASEPVRGQPLTHYDGDDPGPVALVDRALQLGAQLCRALAELHAAGIEHGGLLPSRVLVDPQGTVRIVDVGGTAPVGPTTAPEQIAGTPHDARVDVFAAGALLHEMVAGPREPPEPPVSWHDVQCLERLPDLATLFPEVPRSLAHLLQRMTALDPRDRPSADEAGARLAAIADGAESHEWPEPPFVDPGSWWYPLRSCIGAATGPAVWVLEGPAGSGKQRLAERLQRETLLRGRWTLHARCRADVVGAPLAELLQQLLVFLSPIALGRVATDHGGTIRQFWPQLALPGAPDPDHPHANQAAEATTALLARLAEEQPLLIVLHGLEQADSMTLRALPHLVRRAGPNLGILFLHEPRWARRPSRSAVSMLRERWGAGFLQTQRWSPPRANTLGEALCPDEPPLFTQPQSPYAVVEASLHVLAAWRDEPFAPPKGEVWPLALHPDPVPRPVLHACVGSDLSGSPWVVEEDDALVLSGPTARRLAEPRLGDLRRTARALATEWDHVRPDFGGEPGPVAARWILADKPVQAWTPAARAAVSCARRDRFREARRWLQILDTLDQPTARDQDLEFLLSHARARTALYLDPGAPSRLTEQAERCARTDEHRSWARLLRAERAWRRGDYRSALVKALRAGAPASGAPPEVQIHALLVALRSRIRLGEPSGIERDLLRVQALHQEAPLEAPTRLGLVRAELAYLRDDLLWCRAVSEETLRTATGRRDTLSIGSAALRLASVWRRLGKRAEAERHAVMAQRASADNGDPLLQADAALLLATLWGERGRWLAAEALLERTARTITTLGIRMLEPAAARLSLALACESGDQRAGSAALRSLESAAWGTDADDEWPATLVAWYHRTGDLQRALDVVATGPLTAYGTARLHLERARTGLDAADWGLVSVEATHAVELASRHGFEEVAVQAGLLRGLSTPTDDDAWSAMLRKAVSSPCVSGSLGALALDARRHTGQAAANRWLHLLAQSRQRGYLPGVQEAEAWLSAMPATP